MALDPRTPEIVATRTIAASAADIYSQLADLRDHWEIAGGFVRVVDPDGSSARVELTGPAGLRRTAHTRIERRVENREIEGTARMGTGTLARVRWTLSPLAPAATEVTLRAVVEEASALDRLVLSVGAKAWMARRFEEALGRLEEVLVSARAA